MSQGITLTLWQGSMGQKAILELEVSLDLTPESWWGPWNLSYGSGSLGKPQVPWTQVSPGLGLLGQMSLILKIPISARNYHSNYTGCPSHSLGSAYSWSFLSTLREPEVMRF